MVGLWPPPCILSENNHPPPKSDTVGAEARMGKVMSLIADWQGR